MYFTFRVGEFNINNECGGRGGVVAAVVGFFCFGKGGEQGVFSRPWFVVLVAGFDFDRV